MNKFIPLSVPNLKGNEMKYVTHAIETEWVSSAGPYIVEFETKLADYVGAKGAVACQNGTAGLHVALKVCGIGLGDEVIVPTLTFIAAVNPVKYVGAEPIFMDCDDSLCMDADKLDKFCKNECILEEGKLFNRRTKKCIKAIIVVHVFGNMAEMERIMKVADEYNLKVIEDATEAIGTYYLSGKYKGKYAGTIGTVGVYSFNGNKIITSGGGGMLVSEDVELLGRAKHLTTQAKSDELYYLHDEVGYNYRMTNIQAALGVAQLEQLEEFIKTKKSNFDMYKRGLQDKVGLSLLEVKKDIRCNYWFYALICNDEYGMTRDEIIKYLAEGNIQTRPIWGLIHEQKPYHNSQTYRIEKAVYYREHIVNVPCSSNLERVDVKYIIDILKKG